MEKTETIHVRVSPDIKKQSEEVLNDLGLNLSYAISMYLKQVIIQNRIPFDIVGYDEKEIEAEEELAYALNRTGGKDIDIEGKRLIHLYATKQIDYDTAVYAINKRYLKK